MVKLASIILLIGFSAFGQAFTMRDLPFLKTAISSAAAPAGCTTIKQDLMGTTYTSAGLLAGKTNYVAYRWTPDSSYTVCKIGIRLTKVGTASKTYTPYIYSNSSGSPGTSLGSGTAFNHTSLATGTNYIDGFNVAVTSGTVYWLVIASTPGPDDYFGWWGKDSTFLNNYGKSSPDGTTWTTDATRQGSMLIYGN